MKSTLERALADVEALLPHLRKLAPVLQQVGDTLMQCWETRGKVLLAGNGGSACDAMHMAEELTVRFCNNRRALAAIALCDPAAITCCGNDYAFDHIFSRQIEALGNPGDVLVVFTTSGNSPNILKAIEAAKVRQMKTVAFLGKDGGKAQGRCDLELLVPCSVTQHVQEGHQILYHTLCEWIDAQVK